MITLSTAVFLVVLALVAAIYSILGAVNRIGDARVELLHPADEHKFLPKFFGVESFYRSLLINLCITGVSIAATATYPNRGRVAATASVPSVVFWDWGQPLLWLGLVFLLGLLVALVLRDDYEALEFRTSRFYVVSVATLAVVALFVVVVAVAAASRGMQ